MNRSTNTGTRTRWLLLIHQIPPKPDYFRVKIWRRLQSLGAVAIKNSVYALPNTDQAREDFEWIVREISSGGGEAMVCEARLIEGLSDREAEALFREARGRDYIEIAAEATKLSGTLRATKGKDGKEGERRAELSNHIVRLKRRLAEVVAIDFLEAPARKQAEERIAALESKLRAISRAVPQSSSRSRRKTPAEPVASPSHYLPEDYRGRRWVTRKGIHVDRMASAWLIRRFIDGKARFRFVLPEGYRPRPGELRFDMFEAEFTHEGNRCTFEVLCDRFGLSDSSLRAIGEIVHDIDLKESKFRREETAGISRLIAGISMNHKEDEVRLERGSAAFDDLYECFRRQGDRKKGRSAPPNSPTK